MNSKCVWVVDDDPIFRLIFSMTLKKSCDHYTLIELENGKLACDSLHEGFEGKIELPQFLFMDINMPEMNGWQCMDMIMELMPGSIGKFPKIYIVSSSINNDDEKKAYSYPFTSGYLTKPISIAKFQEILTE